MYMFDFPKNTEWILNRRIETKTKKAYYEFEIWEGRADNTIAYLRNPNAAQMAKKIKALVKKLNNNKK